MKLPPEVTEANFLESVERVVKTLASKFRFGFHEIEDMKQQGILFAIEAMAKGRYDVTRPLDNFLFTHLRNRFINFKRDNYIRNEPPCKSCIFYDALRKKSKNGCAAFENKSECPKLSEWNKRNEIKKSLLRPIDIEIAGTTHREMLVDESNMNRIDIQEFEDLINEEIPAELRSDYLRMRDGVSLPKARKEKIRQIIIKIKNDRNPENGS